MKKNIPDDSVDGDDLTGKNTIKFRETTIKSIEYCVSGRGGDAIINAIFNDLEINVNPIFASKIEELTSALSLCLTENWRQQARMLLVLDIGYMAHPKEGRRQWSRW